MTVFYQFRNILFDIYDFDDDQITFHDQLMLKKQFPLYFW